MKKFLKVCKTWKVSIQAFKLKKQTIKNSWDYRKSGKLASYFEIKKYENG